MPHTPAHSIPPGTRSARPGGDQDLPAIPPGARDAGLRRFPRRTLHAVLSAAILAIVHGCAPAGSVSARAPAPPGPAAPGSRTPLTEDAREWVAETLERLGPEARIRQLLSVWISGGYASASSEELERLAGLVEWGLGSLTISVGLPHAYAAKLNALQARADVPLLVASDFESGGPGFRLGGIYALPYLLEMGGGTELPPTMGFGAIGDPAFAREAGRVTGAEARAVGVHLALAPVLDVNSDPANPIINTRSYGEDPDRVGLLGVAFIQGARSAGLLTAAKHFPGHGDTRVDPHLGLPAIDADRNRLDTLELVPFRRAVAAGVDAIVTGHVLVPRLLGPAGPPATFSRRLLTDLLREEMGFSGLVVTDALDMAAVVRLLGRGEAAVRALEAGADLLLMPPDPREAEAAVLDAVRSGRLSPERLEASVRRVLEAKARAGLHRGRHVPLAEVDRVVGSRAHMSFADTAAARSIVLPRDRESLVPLDPRRARRVVSLTFARRENLPAGRVFDRQLAEGVDSLVRMRLEGELAPGASDSLLAASAEADLIVLSVHLPPRAGAGSVDVPEALVSLVARAREAGTPLALVSFGSPYLLSRFPEAGTLLLAWGSSPVMERAAARALLGRAAITGRLPIALPPFHRRGEGLRRDPVEEPGAPAMKERPEAGVRARATSTSAKGP